MGRMPQHIFPRSPWLFWQSLLMHLRWFLHHFCDSQWVRCWHRCCTKWSEIILFLLEALWWKKVWDDQSERTSISFQQQSPQQMHNSAYQVHALYSFHDWGVCAMVEFCAQIGQSCRWNWELSEGGAPDNWPYAPFRNIGWAQILLLLRQTQAKRTGFQKTCWWFVLQPLTLYKKPGCHKIMNVPVYFKL